MADKITNKIALEYCIKLIDRDDSWCDKYEPDEIIAKLQKMVEQLDKKNASPKKLTAQQEKNEGLKTVILDFLADHEDTGFTVSDLLKQIPEFEGDSNQHVSALMRALTLDHKVEKYSEKRRTYFKVAG